MTKLEELMQVIDLIEVMLTDGEIENTFHYIRLAQNLTVDLHNERTEDTST